MASLFGPGPGALGRGGGALGFMPIRTQTYKMFARTIVKGRIPTADVHAAIRRAQEKNRDLALGKIRIEFMQRGATRQGSGKTLNAYSANVLADLRVSVTNRRKNAASIEYGEWPFRGIGRKGDRRRKPARIIRARNPKTKPLKFFWHREHKGFKGPAVYHPGQKPERLVSRVMDRLEPQFRENVRDEVENELRWRKIKL